jgi:DNA-binding MarR family transcriptional regulator
MLLMNNSQGEEMEIRDFKKVIEFVRKEIFSELPLQQLAMLLLVHEREGISQGEISKLMGMPQATVSRNIARLSRKQIRGDRGQVEWVGYGLVENRIDPVETRQYQVFLTDKGTQFMAKLEQVLAERKGD